jgi:hypothetical protein
MYVCMYVCVCACVCVCMYVRGVGLARPSAPRPSPIYCASSLISPLLIPHVE